MPKTIATTPEGLAASVPGLNGGVAVEPTTAIVIVTPDLAAAWLANNTHNRAVREGKVAAYARDMTAGAWQFNGDVIRFASDGTLIDGQHRLLAIVRSGVPLRAVVVRGLAAKAQDTVDIGTHRSLSDQLQLRGEVNARELAAIARRAVTLTTTAGVSTGKSSAVTHAEMVAYIDASPSIRRAAEVATHASGRLPVAPSMIGTAYHMCSMVDADVAEVFYVTQVIDGVGLYEGDPALVLRLRYLSEATANGRQMAPDDVYRFAVLAWNHYRQGGRLTKLQMPKGGWAGKTPIPR